MLELLYYRIHLTNKLASRNRETFARNISSSNNNNPGNNCVRRLISAVYVRSSTYVSMIPELMAVSVVQISCSRQVLTACPPC